MFTSTKAITGTGLKKCRPPNLSFLCVTWAISEIGNEDVLETKIVWLKKIDINMRDNKIQSLSNLQKLAGRFATEIQHLYIYINAPKSFNKPFEFLLYKTNR